MTAVLGGTAAAFYGIGGRPSPRIAAQCRQSHASAVSDTLGIDERALTESFVARRGRAGRTSTRWRARCSFGWTWRRPGCRRRCGARLERLAGRRLTQAGEVVITAQRHRTQERNRAAAMEALIRLIRRAEVPPVRRVPTRPTGASRAKLQEAKTRRARLKQSRRVADRRELRIRRPCPPPPACR